MVPPERVELSSLAPEASTLSTELQGRIPHSRISRLDRGQQGIGFGEGPLCKRRRKGPDPPAGRLGAYRQSVLKFLEDGYLGDLFLV